MTFGAKLSPLNGSSALNKNNFTFIKYLEMILFSLKEIFALKTNIITNV
jgi:hypothetical protein